MGFFPPVCCFSSVWIPTSRFLLTWAQWWRKRHHGTDRPPFFSLIVDQMNKNTIEREKTYLPLSCYRRISIWKRENESQTKRRTVVQWCFEKKEEEKKHSFVWLIVLCVCVCVLTYRHLALKLQISRFPRKNVIKSNTTTAITIISKQSLYVRTLTLRSQIWYRAEQ